MLIFKCALQPDEINALKKHLPPDEYLIIYIAEEKMSYGIMHEDMHSRFMDILSGETLECFEYLDETDFRKIRDIKNREVIGNPALMDKLSL